MKDGICVPVKEKFKTSWDAKIIIHVLGVGGDKKREARDVLLLQYNCIKCFDSLC